MVPVTVGTKEILTCRTPGGRQFRFDIERDLKYIDGTFEKINSDITNNISNIDKQKMKFLSVISDMRKSLNDHLDEIEKQTVEEMVSVEQIYKCLVLQSFFVTETTPNLETSLTKDSNFDEKSSFISKSS
jgi:NurA-like 5'-3' nuclease